MHLPLREIPPEDRPRERLRQRGAGALSDVELLAILLGSGGRGRDVLQLARELLPRIDAVWPELEPEALEAIPGMGCAKATLVLAALEFARRRIKPHGVRIRESKDILPLLRHLADRQQEHFVCISLNGAHEVIATRVVTIGLVNSTQVHPREVFSDAITDRASAIVVAHNHPSGSIEPSEEDHRATRALREAGAILGIRVLDHIIFTPSGYYSFADAGALK